MLNEEVKNEMKLEFLAKSKNESLARVAVASFMTSLNPTMEELSDVKTAVSEAVTNAIIHGYENKTGIVHVRCVLKSREIYIEVEDKGQGIENIEKAMEPLFTTKPELERSGMGFSFMEAFMDELLVESKIGEGTVIKMKKKCGTMDWLDEE